MPNALAMYGRPMARIVSLRPEHRHRAVVLDDQHVGHDHELHEHEREQHVAAGELEARERVRGERHQHELRREHHRDQRSRC